MSDVPVATPADLQTFLGLDSINNDRAMSLLEAAQDLAETVKDPLPVGAKWVVVQAAARAYASPMGSGDLMLGSGRIATYGKGQSGVYLTDDEKSQILRMAGGSRVGSVDFLPAGYDIANPYGTTP